MRRVLGAVCMVLAMALAIGGCTEKLEREALREKNLASDQALRRQAPPLSPEPLTLAAAVAYALQNNLDVQAARLGYSGDMIPMALS